MAPDEADGETARDARDEARGQDALNDKILRPEAVAARASREAEARTARGGPGRPVALRLEADRDRKRSRAWPIRRLFLSWVGSKANGWKYGCRIIWRERL